MRNSKSLVGKFFTRRRTVFLSLIMYALVFLANGADASGYRGGFANAWESSWIVASGSVTFLDAETDHAVRQKGKYQLQIDKCYKGKFENREIVFYDLSYRSFGGLNLTSGSVYLLFLQDFTARKKSVVRKNLSKNIVTCLWAVKITGDTRNEIESAITLYQNYQRLEDPEERKSYLLEQLDEGNRYVSPYFGREILINKVVEAIPHFEKQLASGSEPERLDAASRLRILGHQDIGDCLIDWLRDSQWKDKAGVILELGRLGMKNAIPEIRKFVYSDNDLLAVRARTTLLEFGEPDAKALLFDTIKTSTSHAARLNAIHALNWNYAGTFTADEIKLVEILTQDKDDSVRRVAGFILEKNKKKQNRPNN